MKNFHVIALHYTRLMDFAQHSRYVAESVECPHPGKEEEKFVEFLLARKSKWAGALIVETNDDTAMALSRHKATLQTYYQLVTPSWDVIRKLIFKQEMYDLAEQCDVPFPRSFFLKELGDLKEIEATIKYPCILKPIQGHLFFQQFRLKNFTIPDREALQSKFHLCQQAGHPVIAQEIIPGADSNIHQCMMYVNRDGKTTAAFFAQKMRQNPPAFGVARVSISEEAIPELKSMTEVMLHRIGFTGIVHSEFKRDSRDQSFKLIEVNPRIARSNWLASYCGVNFPEIAYRDLCETDCVDLPAYRKGVYWIELTQDVANSIWHHRQEKIQFTEYFRPYLSDEKTFAELFSDDFRPFLTRIGNYCVKVATRA